MMGALPYFQDLAVICKAPYVLLIFLILCHFVAAWRLGPASVEIANVRPVQNTNIDSTQSLTDLLTSRIIHEPAVYENARQLISSLNSAPTCNYLAAQRLITACRVVTSDHEHSSRELVIRVKQLYAVRQAVCETGDGGFHVPTACQTLIPKPGQADQTWSNIQPKPGDGVEVVSGKQLGACIAALQQTSQSWTSYSNNLQSAATVCQSLRYEIEQDELLEVYRTMSNVTEYVNIVAQNLSQSLAEDYSTQLMRSQVLSELFTMQIDSLERQHNELREELAARTSEFETSLDVVEVKIEKSMSAAGKNAERISDYLNTNAAKLEQFLAQSYQTAASGVAELSANVLSHTVAIRDIALAIQGDLEQINTYNLLKTFSALFNTSQQLEAQQKHQLMMADVILDKQDLSYGFAEQTVHKLVDMKADAEVAAEKVKQLLGQVELLTHTIRCYTEIVALIAVLALTAMVNIRLAVAGLGIYVVGRILQGSVPPIWTFLRSHLGQNFRPPEHYLSRKLAWVVGALALTTGGTVVFLKRRSPPVRTLTKHHATLSEAERRLLNQVLLSEDVRYPYRFPTRTVRLDGRTRRATTAPPDL